MLILSKSLESVGITEDLQNQSKKLILEKN